MKTIAPPGLNTLIRNSDVFFVAALTSACFRLASPPLMMTLMTLTRKKRVIQISNTIHGCYLGW